MDIQLYYYPGLRRRYTYNANFSMTVLETIPKRPGLQCFIKDFDNVVIVKICNAVKILKE